MLSKPKSLTYEIQIQETEPDLEEEDLVMIVIMTFFLFFTYLVTSSLLHSFGSEDTIFDPGITTYTLVQKVLLVTPKMCDDMHIVTHVFFVIGIWLIRRILKL